MSINDLIHTNAHNAFEQGRKAEQERIVKLLKDTFGTLGIQKQMGSYVFATDLETLIKGEQK